MKAPSRKTGAFVVSADNAASKKKRENESGRTAAEAG